MNRILFNSIIIVLSTLIVGLGIVIDQPLIIAFGAGIWAGAVLNVGEMYIADLKKARRPS